jgi:hypothetical protein
MHNLQQVHFKAIKHIFQYVKNTIEFGIYFLYENNVNLKGWANWAQDLDNCRSTIVMLLKLGHNLGPINFSP